MRAFPATTAPTRTPDAGPVNAPTTTALAPFPLVRYLLPTALTIAESTTLLLEPGWTRSNG